MVKEGFGKLNQIKRLENRALHMKTKWWHLKLQRVGVVKAPSFELEGG